MKTIKVYEHCYSVIQAIAKSTGTQEEDVIAALIDMLNETGEDITEYMW